MFCPYTFIPSGASALPPTQAMSTIGASTTAGRSEKIFPAIGLLARLPNVS